MALFICLRTDLPVVALVILVMLFKLIASWVPHSCPVDSLAFEDPWLVPTSGDDKLAMMDVRNLLRLSSNVKSEKVANCH